MALAVVDHQLGRAALVIAGRVEHPVLPHPASGRLSIGAVRDLDPKRLFAMKRGGGVR